LVSGPTHLKIAHPLVKIINVVSAQEMYDACHLYFKDVDVAIAAAAVADYRPKIVASQK
jgi:phosphopantothenoylcysteine decarboxylase/phosphopantothenate--cysteine ligase